MGFQSYCGSLIEKWLTTRLAGSSNAVQPFSFCFAHVFTRCLDPTRIMREQQNSKFELYSNNNSTVQIYFQIIFEFTWYATSAFTVNQLSLLSKFRRKKYSNGRYILRNKDNLIVCSVRNPTLGIFVLQSLQLCLDLAIYVAQCKFLPYNEIKECDSSCAFPLAHI